MNASSPPARGAACLPSGVRFSLWAPDAQQVSVHLEGGDIALSPDGRGGFTGLALGCGHGADYRFVVDGEPTADPASRWQPEGVFGPSRVLDSGSFRWTDRAWRGVARDALILYEIHIGTFTAEGTFDAAIARLDDLVDLGISAVEVMPVSEFPGERNWGYDGVFPYSVESSYGGPAGLARFVDAAHARGLAVILDMVYNHLGPEGNVLWGLAPYFTQRYQTPWGPAINFDDAGSDEVRRYVIDNAVQWIAEYHLDGLRLDAVHAIYDLSARHVLSELGEAAHAAGRGAGRQVHVIAETDQNDPRIVRPELAGGVGLDAAWCDDLHHAVHVLLTGERSGYYEDFTGLADVARAWRRGYVYDGRYSKHRGRRHGGDPTGITGDQLVVCLQNHDQVGNRALGRRLTALTGPAPLRMGAALVLLSPYLPLIFMGEEHAERAPFAYFVSHQSEDLLQAVREGRRTEFAAFGWGEVPDPADAATFERSRVGWERSPAGRAHRALYQALIALRQRPALRPGHGERDVACDEDAGWMRVVAAAPFAAPLLLVFNARDEDGEVPVPSGVWRRVLSTEVAAFGGAGALAPEQAGFEIPLRPWEAAVYEGARSG